MNCSCHPCHRRREVCLFAAGALPEQDRPEIEQHLAACAGCRDYYNEIKTLAAPLANWEKNFAQLEPTQAMRSRWAGAVQTSAAEAVAREPLLKWVWRNVWRELIWPSRRAWVGLAALWLVLLAVNARLSDHPMQMAGARSPSPADIMLSWDEQTRLLAELTQPAMVHSAPVNPPAAPCQSSPSPQRAKPDWQIA